MKNRICSAPTEHTPKQSSKEIICKANKKGKLKFMLEQFAKGAHLHRFQAEPLGDHCLHTTISDLQTKHGIYFNRVTIQVPTRFNKPAKVKLYWLQGENLEKAKQICGVTDNE